MLELPDSTVLASITIKNAGSAFVRCMVGTKEQLDRIQNGCSCESIGMETLIPSTQLFSLEQLVRNETAKAHKAKTFRGFSRFIGGEARGGWRVVVVECAPFYDSRVREVGLSWVQIFGKKAEEEATPVGTRPLSIAATVRNDLAGDGPRKRKASAPEMKCNCGEEAYTRTIRKPGEEFGKTLYICAKEESERCDFSAVR